MSSEFASRIRAFEESWKFTRSLTIDLLCMLSQDELLWSPGTKIGALWKQFRHVGRVQEDYMNALDSGNVEFCPDGRGYTSGPDAQQLIAYLEKLDEKTAKKLPTLDSSKRINWFGEEVDCLEHLSRLTSHEVLHHGQWIIQLQLMDKVFPESWSIWGLETK